MTSVVCVIDETGIHAPAFEDILTFLKNSYRSIYGKDVYLDNDSQDGQLLGLFAAAINDANAMAVAVYNAFSPSTAQGAGLSRVVRINGIARLVPSYSTVDLVIVGQAGTTITNGVARDASEHQWKLPASFTIPPSGEVTVTATAATMGALTAAAHTVTAIATPTRGWQSVGNPLAAVPGAPVESDARLRQRQGASTAIPSRTVLDGMIGAVAQVDGVTRYSAYENDSELTDSNGIQGHRVSLVVDGGDAAAIASAIALKKTPGSGTHGTTSQTVTDAYGIPHAIRFYRPTVVPITVALTVKAMAGYTAAIEARIRQAVADWINGLAIGADVLLTRVYVPANLNGGAGSGTFEITLLKIARDGGTPGTSDLVIAFNEAAQATITNVQITVM